MILTKTKRKLNIPADIEEAEYPPEVVDRWDRIFEITKLQIETGAPGPRTIEEAAAELGIILDD